MPTLSVTLHDGLVNRDSLDRKTDTNLAPDQHLRVEPGDIAYNMMRMWQGASGQAGYPALVSPAYVVLKPTHKIDSLFASYLFKSSRVIYLLWAYSYGLTSDRLRLYYNDFALIPYTIPNIEEQRRIAEILGTWDRAIETTEKLIAASEAQKKALMQQLLTGKKRLPGFKGKWREVPLGDLAECYSGGTPKRNVGAYYGGDIPWIKSGELNQRKIDLTEENITAEGLKQSSAKLVAPDTVLLALYGATAGVVSETKIEAAINQAILAIIPSDDLSKLYLYFTLLHAVDEMKRLTQGGQPNLNAGIVKALRISLPTIEEQHAISSSIDNADRVGAKFKQKLQTLKTEKPP